MAGDVYLFSAGAKKDKGKRVLASKAQLARNRKMKQPYASQDDKGLERKRQNFKT